MASRAATEGGRASGLWLLVERADLPPFCPFIRTVCVDDARVGVRGGMTTGRECLSMSSAGSAGETGVHAGLTVRGASGFLVVCVPIFSARLLRVEGGEWWRYVKDLGEIMVGDRPWERFPVTDDGPNPSTARGVTLLGRASGWNALRYCCGGIGWLARRASDVQGQDRPKVPGHATATVEAVVM